MSPEAVARLREFLQRWHDDAQIKAEHAQGTPDGPFYLGKVTSYEDALRFLAMVTEDEL